MRNRFSKRLQTRNQKLHLNIDKILASLTFALVWLAFDFVGAFKYMFKR